MTLPRFDLQNPRLLRLNALISVPLLLMLLGLAGYFFNRGESSSGLLLLGLGVGFLVLQAVSFTVLAKRGALRARQ